jgi:preprotein translocase subunit YajC
MESFGGHPLILIFAIMYFLCLSVRSEKQATSVDGGGALRRGDQVVTAGGGLSVILRSGR